jgi:hypothetical protein
VENDERQSFDRALPGRFRPTYAGANMGHPCSDVMGKERIVMNRQESAVKSEGFSKNDG